MLTIFKEKRGEKGRTQKKETSCLLYICTQLHKRNSQNQNAKDEGYKDRMILRLKQEKAQLLEQARREGTKAEEKIKAERAKLTK